MKRPILSILAGMVLGLLATSAYSAAASPDYGPSGHPALVGSARLPAAPAGAVSPSGRAREFDATAWGLLLQKYRRGGRVDYAAWKKDGTQELDALLAAMTKHPYRTVFAKEARIAFLINAYNAFAIRQVLGAYPVASPKNIPGFFDKTTLALDGGSYTLDQIEKELLAPISPTEPRFRLALCRAAIGTPALYPHPIAGDSLVVQLDRITLDFMRNPDLNRLRGEEPDTLFLSEFFQWYRRDFESGDDTLVRRLAPNFGLGQMIRILQKEPPIRWIPMDWRLNDREKPAGGR